MRRSRMSRATAHASRRREAMAKLARAAMAPGPRVGRDRLRVSLPRSS
jgi:hypothetical protein